MLTNKSFQVTRILETLPDCHDWDRLLLMKTLFSFLKIIEQKKKHLKYAAGI